MKNLYLTTKPVSVNNRYTISRGKLILSEDYRAAKEALAWEIASQWNGEPLPLDTEVTVNIIHRITKNKIDVDGYIKILLDAMAGIVYVNDRQVFEIGAIKELGEEEGTHIQVVW